MLRSKRRLAATGATHGDSSHAGVVEAQAWVGGAADAGDVVLDRRHLDAKKSAALRIIIHCDMVHPAVRGEEQVAVARELAGMDRIHQRESADAECAEHVARGSEYVAAC